MSTAFPPAQPLRLPEVTLSVHEAGEGPAVVLCHGFPELAYSWRHQFAPLVDAGFHVIAPDQRGYGSSDAPAPIAAYSLAHLTGDLVALLDAKGIEKAVFVGHDWGGFVAWAMPIAHPRRVAGVVGVNTPYMPMPTTAMMRSMVQDDSQLYILWFQEPGVAEAVLDADPELCFRKLMRRGVPFEQIEEPPTDANPFHRLADLPEIGPAFLSDEEIAEYVRAFSASSFRGGINWYRNVDRNAAQYPDVGSQKLELPCLMVTAQWDAALRPELAAGMPQTCSDLETHMIEDCGHWTQQERPAELNAILVDWLRRRFGSSES